MRAGLVAQVRAYIETFAAYGGAVLTLLTEAARHEPLRPTAAAPAPGMARAAPLIASHQAAGRLSPGDPPGKVVTLIAPILISGLWAKTGMQADMPAFEPEDLVEAFLAGHAA